MHRSFLLIVSLSTISTVLIDKASFSLVVPLAQATPSTKVVFETQVPICYIETTNGSILDLSNLCKQKQKNSSVRRALPSSSPYNNSAIQKFNDELYGEDN